MTIDARFRVHRSDFSLEVDLSIPDRGVTAVFGPSGCGKTTFLRAVAGLEHPPGGFLKVGDTIWQEANRIVPTHQRSLGYVFQEASLFAHLNVRRNLEYGVKRVPVPQRKVSIQQAVELLGIGPLLRSLGGASVALGLLCVGAALSPGALRDRAGVQAATCAVKLVAVPAMTLALGLALGLDRLSAAVALVFMALPTATTSYVMARALGGDAPLMAALTTTEHVASVATLPLWIALVGRLPG